MKSLLSMSEGASLALHGLALVAKKHPQRVSAKELATDLAASESHLAKIFQKLHRAGFVDSVRGPAGGFFLARASEDISLMDIYQVIDGDYRSSACPLGKTQCLFADCIFRGRISEILAELHDKLASIHLSDIVSQKEPACITKTGLAKKK